MVVLGGGITHHVIPWKQFGGLQTLLVGTFVHGSLHELVCKGLAFLAGFCFCFSFLELFFFFLN